MVPPTWHMPGISKSAESFMPSATVTGGSRFAPSLSTHSRVWSISSYVGTITIA